MRPRSPLRRALGTAALCALASCGRGPTPDSPDAATAREVTAEAPGSEEPDPVAEDGRVPRRWLPTHQAADGSWEAAGWARWQMGERLETAASDDLGRCHNDVAVTGFAVLTLLGLGYGPRYEEPMGSVTAWGLHALVERQGGNGCLSDEGRPLWATNHAIGAWALAEAAAAGAGDATVTAARRAFAFLERSLAAGDAAWARERGPADLPALAWAVEAYEAAREADQGLRREPDPRPALLGREGPFEAARAEVAGWVAAEGAERTVGRASAGLLARARTDPEWKKAPDTAQTLEWLAAHAPTWDASGEGVDWAGWMLGTRATFAAGGDVWKRWDAALRAAVVDTQRKDGDPCGVRGSWDPVGIWGSEGGRVFATAAAGLVLSIHYRYDKVFEDYDESAAPPPRTTAPPPPRPPPVDPRPERRYGRCR